jgi:hypothetical protein
MYNDQKGLSKGIDSTANEIPHSSSGNPSLCRKDENLIKPLPYMALQNYTGSRQPPSARSSPPHPFMVTEFDREPCDDVIKLRSSNENIRFIRERPRGLIEKNKARKFKIMNEA